MQDQHNTLDFKTNFFISHVLRALSELKMNSPRTGTDETVALRLYMSL